MTKIGSEDVVLVGASYYSERFVVNVNDKRHC
jgi:hypothetical protein